MALDIIFYLNCSPPKLFFFNASMSNTHLEEKVMKINSYLFVFKSSMLDIEFDAEIKRFIHIIDQLRLLPKINPSIFKIRNLSWFIQDIPN